MDQPRITFQRDFYYLLLRLDESGLDLRDILSDVLTLIAQISDAEQGYLEVRNAENECVYQTFSMEDADVPSLQQTISTGIVAEAIRTGETLLIPSALLDPRFQTRESVQRSSIETVLCMPFLGQTTRGVLYLQGDRGFRSQAEKIKLDSELFARHVSPLLDRLLIEHERRGEADPLGALRNEFQLDGVVGRSNALFQVLKSAMMVAPLDVTTLLLGETGTGKTQLAHLIHKNSRRKTGPFIEINCAALPATLAENELFGAEPGGHSSATRAVTGKLAAADGGTLFLAEVGELNLEIQAKLLQFLQSGQYFALGSARPARADIRLICATNQALRAGVSAGTFRQDLLYRINTFEIPVPSLDERRGDIALLAHAAASTCCERHGFPVISMTPEATAALAARAWPGNIRELNNVVERMCINARMEGALEVSDAQVAAIQTSMALAGVNVTDFQQATQAFQRGLIERKLADTGWNISQTARELNLSRSHMHNLIRSLGLARDE